MSKHIESIIKKERIGCTYTVQASGTCIYFECKTYAGALMAKSHLLNDGCSNVTIEQVKL